MKLKFVVLAMSALASIAMAAEEESIFTLENLIRLLGAGEETDSKKDIPGYETIP